MAGKIDDGELDAGIMAAMPIHSHISLGLSSTVLIAIDQEMRHPQDLVAPETHHESWPVRRLFPGSLCWWAMREDTSGDTGLFRQLIPAE
jgi:hypothetical protein